MPSTPTLRRSRSTAHRHIRPLALIKNLHLWKSGAVVIVNLHEWKYDPHGSDFTAQCLGVLLHIPLKIRERAEMITRAVGGLYRR